LNFIFSAGDRFSTGKHQKIARFIYFLLKKRPAEIKNDSRK
jgi:hypothetical protein